MVLGSFSGSCSISASFLRSAYAAAYKSESFFFFFLRVAEYFPFPSLPPTAYDSPASQGMEHGHFVSAKQERSEHIYAYLLVAENDISSGCITSDGFAELLGIHTLNSAKSGQTVLRRLRGSHCLQLCVRIPLSPHFCRDTILSFSDFCQINGDNMILHG